jgi:hypothetical protein
MTTYAELTQQLQDWLEDDDTEFVGSIDEVISLGEKRLWRDLDLSLFTATETTAATVGTDFITKPTANPMIMNFDQLYYDDGARRIWLEHRSSDFVRDMQRPGIFGKPRYYAEQSETTWQIAPMSDGNYTIQARGVAMPIGLSATQTTTWFSIYQSDLLLKGCLAEAEKFLKSDDRAPMWEQDYINTLPAAKRDLYTMLKARYNLTPLQIPGVPTTQR